MSNVTGEKYSVFDVLKVKYKKEVEMKLDQIKQALLNSIGALPITQLVKFVYWLEKEAETKLYEEEALKTLEDLQERERIERSLKQRFCEHKLKTKD